MILGIVLVFGLLLCIVCWCNEQKMSYLNYSDMIYYYLEEHITTYYSNVPLPM